MQHQCTCACATAVSVSREECAYHSCSRLRSAVWLNSEFKAVIVDSNVYRFKLYTSFGLPYYYVKLDVDLNSLILGSIHYSLKMNFRGGRIEASRAK